MNTIFFNAKTDDNERRELLYEGQLVVYSATRRSLELCQFASELARDAFAPHDPEVAHRFIPVEQYVEILAALKPKFIHHPRSKELIQGLLTDLDCDLEKTYFDVPRLRTMAPDDYLTAGLAYAFHPHRDTWFSAPPCQLNWWLPVFDIRKENTMAFHPKYWGQAVRNSSREYDYYKWNKESRREASKQIKVDTRKQPQAEEALELDSQLRIVCEEGGLVIFSGAQMHSTVRNTSGLTRFSIDFRTVHLDDVLARRGAPLIDSACTGTTLRDFLRGSDYARLPDETAALYDERPPADGELIYMPEAANRTGGPVPA